MEIKQITQQEVNEIFDNGFETGKYKPLGYYYVESDGTYMGIDNSTGNAWVEDFDNLADCIAWLNGDDSDNNMEV